MVYISRLDEQWLKDYKKPLLDKPRFLYVGRLNPEKGIFEFLKMFDELTFDSELSIVGRAKNTSSINKKVKLFFNFFYDLKTVSCTLFKMT